MRPTATATATGSSKGCGGDTAAAAAGGEGRSSSSNSPSCSCPPRAPPAAAAAGYPAGRRPPPRRRRDPPAPVLLLLLLAAAAVPLCLCGLANAATLAAAAAPAGDAAAAAADTSSGGSSREQLLAHHHRSLLLTPSSEGEEEEAGAATAAAAAAATATADLQLDELPLFDDEVEEEDAAAAAAAGGGGGASSRKLMSAVLAGPLPGLHFVPRGFPSPTGLGAGGLGLMARLGAFGPAGAAAAAAAVPGGVGPVAAGAGVGLASYVVLSTDPVAIALRQLSIVAIQAYGTAVQNSIKRGIKAIDVQLARYAAYLKRLAKQLDAADAAPQLQVAQQEIRALVIARAALKDYGARQVSYVKFLTSASSAWTSWFYGIQYRFTTLTISLQWGNDPIQLELNRVLYSLADATKLSGLLLQPFIDAFKYEQRFSAALFNILFDAYNRERNRLTVTPVALINAPLGSGQNLAGVIARVRELAQQLGGERGAADALRTAALTARDQVAAALGTGGGRGGGGGMGQSADSSGSGSVGGGGNATSAETDSNRSAGGGGDSERPGVAALERLTDMLKQRAQEQQGQQQQQQAQSAGSSSSSG